MFKTNIKENINLDDARWKLYCTHHLSYMCERKQWLNIVTIMLFLTVQRVNVFENILIKQII